MRWGHVIGTTLGLSALTTLGVSGAAAHPVHPSHGISPAIPAGVFLASLLVVGAGLYLDRRPDVDRLWADLGVGLGILGCIVALGLLVV